MRSRLVALVVGLLVAGTTGCGTSTEDAYCADLKKHQSVFAQDDSGVGLIKQFDQLRALAAAAPDDLSDEWQRVVAAVSGLRDALAREGLAPEDFAFGKVPDTLDAAARDRIAAAASQLTDPGVVEAFNGIDQQAKDVCKLQLGL